MPFEAYHWGFGDGAVGARPHGDAHLRRRPLHARAHDRRAAPGSCPGRRRSRSASSRPRRAEYGADGDAAREVEPKVPVRLGGRLFRDGELTITVTQPFLTVSAGPGRRAHGRSS